jgi:hypothetical protein
MNIDRQSFTPLGLRVHWEDLWVVTEAVPEARSRVVMWHGLSPATMCKTFACEQTDRPTNVLNC